VFAAVLNARIADLAVPARPATDAATAVADLMANACRNMLRHGYLAHAMIVSTQAARVACHSLIGAPFG
jgi:hypothetical protein